MNVPEGVADVEDMTPTAVTPAFHSDWLRALVARLVGPAKYYADCYAAAAAYEDLSRLSDTALAHRGLSRDVLGRDL